MGTRIFFFVIALGLVGAGVWAYHHDHELRKNSMQLNLGDPNEVVRELLGDPSSEGPCGSLTAVPRAVQTSTFTSTTIRSSTRSMRWCGSTNQGRYWECST